MYSTLFSLIASVLLVGLLSPQLQAQLPSTTGSSDSLELAALLESIQSANSALRVSELRRRAALAEIDAAGSLEDPQLSYRIAPSSIGDSIPSAVGDVLGVRQIIQVNQAIPWPGKRALRRDLARTRAYLAEYSREELEVALVDQGRQLWLQMWFIEAAQEVYDEQQALLESLEEVVEEQYAGGLGLQQQLLEVETEQIRLEHRTLVLAQERRRLRAQVNQLLDRAPGSPLASPSEMLPVPVMPTPARIIERVLESSFALKTLRTRAELEGVEQELVALDDYPDFQVSAGYNELWNDSSLRSTIGISVNIPVDFGKRSARKAAAGFAHASARADVRRKEIALQAEVEQLLSEYEELSHSITLYEEQLLPTAEQSYEASLANYQAGGGEFQTLIEVREELLILNLQLQQMRMERPGVSSRLNRLAGGSLWAEELNQ